PDVALQPAPRRAAADAVLGRGLVALLGAAALGSALPAPRSRARRHALLAPASRRADRLLAQLPPGTLDAAAVRRLPRRPRRPRARQRRGRGAPDHDRSAALPGRLHGRRAAAARARARARRREEDDAPGVPRHGPARRADADRAGPGATDRTGRDA